MMFEELFHHPMFRESSSDNPGLPVLMMSSMLRDDFPWLYELGIQLYRAIEEGDSRAIERARRTIKAMIEMTHHSPFIHDLKGGSDDDEALMALEHLVHIVDRYIQQPMRRRKPESQPDEKKP